MCCFSQSIELVANTQIFCRGSAGMQFIVYSMTFAASGDLAMVLPLPVPPNPADDAVRFVNLERYPDFFDDLQTGFVKPAGRSLELSFLSKGLKGLQVHEVGSFEASFVPSISDFDRLDDRFRIPHDVWEEIPDYSDFGFAVFKLKGEEATPKNVHPMAMVFPSRNPELLYFPTLHIHDRKVHTFADFDHMLYCQTDRDVSGYLDNEWEKSNGNASKFIDISRTNEIVSSDLPCWRLPLNGRRENKDALVGANGEVPQPKKSWKLW